MSEQNVEAIRSFYETLNAWLASYWADPGLPIKSTPELDELFDRLDPEAEWDWLFSGETFRGREQLLRAVADWIETVGYWRIEVEELVDGTDDRVLAVLNVLARGRGSGAPADQQVFAVITVRDGKIARIHDHTEREAGLETAGLGS